MPFTLAHPAAAVPLFRRLGKYGVLSALVIGSVTPDMHTLLLFHIGREQTHSLAGLFRFCLPVGFFCYLLFHLVLKLPLYSLLPHAVAARLAPYARLRAPLPKVPWTGVAVSLFFGALTHLAWDALTHGATFGIRSLGFLQTTLFSIGEYPVHFSDPLQAASSIIGVWLLVRWSLNWLREAKPEEMEIPLANVGRRIMILLILLFALAAMLSGVQRHPGSDLFNIIGKLVSGMMASMLIPIFGYGVAWHVMRLRKGG